MPQPRPRDHVPFSHGSPRRPGARTFGTITFAKTERRWLIRCEPHVRLRLKRVFERVHKGSHDTIGLSDTIENARELAWFLERYPMQMAAPDRAHLNARAAAHREKETLIATILARGYRPRRFTLAVPAREYQAVAADLALRTGILLIADDLGTGKSCSVITALTDPATRPALVVTLAHLPRQWVEELQKFAPALRVHVLKKGTPYDLGEPFPDVIIANYHKLSGWADTLAPLIKAVAFDEVQELRRAGDEQRPSQKYAAAQHLAAHARYVFAASATPIYNYGDEIFTVFDCMKRGVLGTKAEFAREWCDGRWGKRAFVADPKALGHYLRAQGLMLRRTRAEVGRELPPLQRIVHTIESDRGAFDHIDADAAGLARAILARSDAAYRGATREAAAEFDMLLRQATGVAKAPYVATFVRMLIESGERIVLYGWHRAVYAIWAKLFADLEPAWFTGSESPSKKHEEFRRFVRGKTPLFIMSLRAGAGLDGLQGHCRTPVFGELDWSPGVLQQCLGRVHRDGQEEPCVAYFLVSEDGADPVMADVLGLKAQQSEGIRDPDAALIEKLEVDPEHMRRLAEAYLATRGDVPAPPESEVAHG